MDWDKAFDVETLREKQETQVEWELRKDFIVEYRLKFKSGKLLSLSTAYVNIEILECKYPKPLMIQMRQYSAGLKGIKVIRDNEKERIRKMLEPIQKKVLLYCPPTLNNYLDYYNNITIHIHIRVILIYLKITNL